LDYQLCAKIVLFISVISSLVPGAICGSVNRTRSRDMSMAIVGSEGISSSPECGVCLISDCPIVTPQSCPGLIEMDECECCATCIYGSAMERFNEEQIGEEEDEYLIEEDLDEDSEGLLEPEDIDITSDPEEAINFTIPRTPEQGKKYQMKYRYMHVVATLI